MARIDVSEVLTPESSDDFMEHGENYAFYDCAETGNDRPLRYGHLLESAQLSIEIWDPYLNIDILEYNIFSMVTNPVKITFLTCKAKSKLDIYNLPNLVRENINISIRDSVEIELYYLDKGDENQKKYQCHDRFLIIDDERFFLVGSSIAYHSRLGIDRESTGIYEIEHERDKALIRTHFDKYLQVASIKGNRQTTT